MKNIAGYCAQLRMKCNLYIQSRSEQKRLQFSLSEGFIVGPVSKNSGLGARKDMTELMQ